MESPLDAALAYCARGWYVFPVVAGGKNPHPMLGVEGGFKHATLDRTKIEEWWSRDPNASIGISLAPSGLVALDVDVGPKKQGRESLVAIVDQLPNTLTARTGGGGIHAIYRRTAAVQIRRVIGTESGLDLLGFGYIIAAPSLHPNGNRYEWIDDLPIAPLPEVLNQIFLSSTEPTEITAAEAHDAPKITEGGRNNALFRLGCALRDTGLTPSALRAAVFAENQSRISPPLPDREVETLVASVLKTVHPSRDVALAAVVQTIEAAPVGPPRLSALVGEIATRKRRDVRTYPTPFPELDRLIGGGFMTGQVSILLGPPGAGKSGLVAGCMVHLEKQVPQLLIATELESEEMAARIAAGILEKPWTAIERGFDADAARKVLADLKIHIVGAESISRGDGVLAAIANEIALVSDEYRVPPVVWVDYLQDLARGGPANDARARIGDMVTGLRELSQTADCSINAVSSVSRSWYGPAKAETMRGSDDPSIYLAAAKESGDVDYAAATVIFLDVEKVADVDAVWNPARLCVAKARRGRNGFVGAKFFGATGRWIQADEIKAQMTPEARAAKAEAKATAELEAAIIAKAGERPQTKTELVKAVNGNDRVVGHHIDHMLIAGSLVAHLVHDFNAAGKRVRPAVLLPPGAIPPQTKDGVITWPPPEKPPEPEPKE